MQVARRWGVVGLMPAILLGLGVQSPVSAINQYPQVNSKTLQSGKDTLEWGDRYQVNVCDNHHKWSSMTLWVRGSKASAWKKIGRTTKVNDTRKWPQQPAKCRYFAAFEWTVDKPEKGFGTVTFGYGKAKPEYTFRGIVKNVQQEQAAPAPAPAPAQPAPRPQFVGTVIPDNGSANNATSVDPRYSLMYGRTVSLWTCTNNANYSPYRGQLYARLGHAQWQPVASAVFANNTGDCKDPMYPVKVTFTWAINLAGVVDAFTPTDYPSIQLGVRIAKDAYTHSDPSSIWGYAIVWPDPATCRTANYSGC